MENSVGAFAFILFCCCIPMLLRESDVPAEPIKRPFAEFHERVLQFFACCIT